MAELLSPRTACYSGLGTALFVTKQLFDNFARMLNCEEKKAICEELPRSWLDY